eukprot:TRINITY_DN931_c0_g1_i2.p1 TRINITY_DN931_c0_g1~~TRINITY_DN931_c0_g1_i2.p1  ORF type:complete len:405 (+),score=89.56 TRINITY_DN931_c0_g1_i2:131-1345(+)
MAFRQLASGGGCEGGNALSKAVSSFDESRRFHQQQQQQQQQHVPGGGDASLIAPHSHDAVLFGNEPQRLDTISPDLHLGNVNATSWGGEYSQFQEGTHRQRLHQQPPQQQRNHPQSNFLRYEQAWSGGNQQQQQQQQRFQQQHHLHLQQQQRLQQQPFLVAEEHAWEESVRHQRPAVNTRPTEWTREFARYEAPALGSQFNRYEQVYAQQSRQRLEWQDEFADYVPDVDRDFGDLERAYEEVAQPKSAAETAEEWAREFEESGERLEEETWFANFISEGEASVGQQTPTPRVVRTRPQYGRMTPTQTSSSMTTSSSATNSGVQDSEELRRLAGEIENIGDPKLQNSRFMTFIRDINRGDVDLSAGDNGGSGGDADGAGNRRAGGDNGSGGRRTQTPHSLPGDTT